MSYKAIPSKAWVSDDWYDPEPKQTCDVWITNKEPTDTGLVDAYGTKIYRIPEETPFGFCRS